MRARSVWTRPRSDSSLRNGVLLTPWRLRWFQTNSSGFNSGRVARQEVQLQAPGEALDVLRDRVGNVRGMAIEDEEHGALAAAHEVPQQLDEPRGVEPLGVDLVPEFAAGVDGGDGAHALPPAARGDLWGVSPQSPGAPEHLVGAHPGLIEEEDLRAGLRGAGAQAREHRHRPAFDRHRIALIRAPQRLLRRDVQLGAQ